MNRRDLLAELAVLPFVKLLFRDGRIGVEKVSEVDAVKVGDGENVKYVVFYDVRSIDPNGLGANPLDEHDPLTHSEWIPVYLHQGQNVQDVIAVYKMPGEKA